MVWKSFEATVNIRSNIVPLKCTKCMLEICSSLHNFVMMIVYNIVCFPLDTIFCDGRTHGVCLPDKL